jgi:hypothetical protein
MCSSCKETYHVQCISDEPHFEKPNWTCNEPYRGVEWGTGDITNTCTINDVLTLAVMEDCIDNTFISNFQEGTPVKLIFKQCAIEAKLGNDDQRWSQSKL